MAPRRARLVLAAILAVACALRLGHVLAQRGDVLFEHPVLDEDHYVQQARALVAGHADPRPYWQPPGIVYALAATFEVAGDGLLAPRLLQVAISIASCGVLFLIGRRLFGVRTGLAAAAIVAVHGVLVFECGELLPATWIVFFDLLALWFLLRAREHGRLADAAAAGLALGVSAVFAPTILPFVAIAALLLVRKRPLAIAALVAGVVLPLAPVAIRNARSGEVVLVSTNGGLNLYLGNNAAYRETFALRPGRHWEELTTEPARHGIAQPGEASAYFRRAAFAFAADDPLAAGALLARKLYLVVHGAEIPRDTDLYAARASSPVIAALVAPRPIDLPDGLLIPAALLGIVALWPERRRLAAPLAMLATLALALVVVFVSSRHRAPALPLFALFAAAGAAPIARRWAAWPPLARAGAVAGAALLVVVTNLPTWETELSYAGELDFYRGLAATDRADARAAFARATAANPGDARAWFELGNALEGAPAVAAWRRAAALDPWDSRAARRIAQALVQAGDLDGAIATLDASIAAHLHADAADYAPDHLNLAFLHARRGDRDAALAALAAAVRADPTYVHRSLPALARAAHADPAIDPAFLAALDALAAPGGPR